MTSKPTHIRLLDCRAGIHPIQTRMPFRYGNACLTASPVLTVEVEIEGSDGGGRRATGRSSDCLPPRWFDKNSEKEYRENVADQIEAFRIAKDSYLDAGSSAATAHELWQQNYPRIVEACGAKGLNQLTASFGSSFFERAIIDAICRLRGESFHACLLADALGLATSTHIAREPLRRIACRHTVGLADPITRDEIPPEDLLNDGLPQALEDCIQFYGLRYFKVKVMGQHDRDIDRLSRMARLFDAACPRGYTISLDGNEQYRDLDAMRILLEELREQPKGGEFVDRILYIEQPLARDLALDTKAAAGIETLSEFKPVIIDESDDSPESLERAIALGYRGSSHKNCKGIFKSLLNHRRIQEINAEFAEPRYFLTAEDLACTATIPLQADLASIASLGIEHAERNGHHYFHGLDHLPPSEAESALDAHPDLYERRGGSVCLRISEGNIETGSLQCPGYGYAGEFDLAKRTPLDDWSFDEFIAGAT